MENGMLYTLVLNGTIDLISGCSQRDMGLYLMQAHRSVAPNYRRNGSLWFGGRRLITDRRVPEYTYTDGLALRKREGRLIQKR